MLPNSRRRRRWLLMGDVASLDEPPPEELSNESSPESPPREREVRSMHHQFSEDCHSGGLSVSVAVGEDGDWTTTTFEAPFVLVGRDDGCGVVLPGVEISRRHAYLQVVGRQIFFADLGSRKGIFRGERQVQSGLLLSGEEIQIGKYRIRAVATPTDGEESTSHDEFGSERIALEFVNHARRLHAWNVERSVTLLGSSRPCKVRLEHSSVSRVHCSLVRGSHGWWVVDLSARNGTLLDGQKIEFAPLRIGSELQVGHYRIKIQAPSDSDTGEETSIIEEAVERSAVVTEITRSARATLTANRESSPRRGSPAVTEQLVIELFREFSALHERTLTQVQQSFRELLDVAMGQRALAHHPASPAPPAPAPTPAAEADVPKPAAPKTSPPPRPETDLPPDSDVPNLATINLASSADPEEREAAHDLLAAQLQNIEANLQKDRRSIARRLMKSLSLIR